MASPEKEEKGEFEDYHVTEEELPHTGWEMREARFDPYQEAYEVYELEDGQTNEMFSKGEISSQEKEIGLLHHKSKYLNTCIRKMEIDYEGRKKQIMDIMERSLEDKIS